MENFTFSYAYAYAYTAPVHAFKTSLKQADVLCFTPCR